MEEKFSDETTYRKIAVDPTQDIKEELIVKLKLLLRNNTIDEKLYDDLYPDVTQIPRAYGSPKIHKEGYPLREIVDSTNSAAKKIDKYVSRIIKTYTLDNPHNIKNSRDFVDKIGPLVIDDDKQMISFDVVALYPSVPQDQALDILEEHMMNDPELKTKTPIPAEELMDLFKICLKRTYFVFNSQLYVQVDGLAIGASSSVFLAEIFMIRLERKALTTFASPPDIWFRYVDDTFTIMKRDYIQAFLDHLNNQHQRIKFTIEYEENNQMPFLDTLICVEEDRTITTKVYRKQTHTNQYLHFKSNHHTRQKIGIVSTLKKRLDLVTKEEDKKEEERIIENAFSACGYPEWVTKRKNKGNTNKSKEKDQFAGRISMPYTKGLSERISRKMKKHNIDVVHKPTATLKNILCSKAKDRLDPMDKPGAIYHIKCSAHNVEYVGETGKQTKQRMYQHRVIPHKDFKRSHSLIEPPKENQNDIVGTRKSSRNVQRKDYKAMNSGSDIMITVGDTVVSEHLALQDHQDGDVTFKLLDFERNWSKRKWKEKIAINKLGPSLNGNEGHYISPIFDPVPSKYCADIGPRPADVTTTTRGASDCLDNATLQVEKGR